MPERAQHRPLTAANDGSARALGVVSIVAAACACFWSSDGDLGFHLATGREVLATGRIPSTNVLSFGEPEHAWELHQWLPGVLFELLHRTWGIAAVTGLKMAVVAATWAVVYRSARVAGASVASSALVCLLGVAASAFRFEARPYLFTHLTLALVVLACAKYARGATHGALGDPVAVPAREADGADTRGLRGAGEPQESAAASVSDGPAVAHHASVRRAARGSGRAAGAVSGGWRACAAAGCVVAVGCQLHAGVLDGVLVLMLFALGRRAAPPALAAVGGVIAGAGLLELYHPLGARVLLFPFRMGSDSYLAEHLVEFRPPWAFSLGSLAAFWLLLGLFVVVGAARARFIDVAWLLLGVAFALLSLRFVRMAFAFTIVVAPALALSFEHARMRVRALVLGVLALCVPLYTFREHTPGFGYEPVVWPRPHFDFVRAHSLQGNAFVSDAWAGPFLGSFYPERRSFFDNRLEAYSPGFMRDVYQRIRYAEPGWDALLDRYAIEVLLLRYTTERERELQHGAPNLRQRLARDQRFTLVRFDDVGALFVRTQGANAALAEALQLRGVDPDRRVFTAEPAAAAPALLRAVQRGERSATLLGLTAQALAARGEGALAGELAQEAVRVAPEDRWAQQLVAQLMAARR